MGYNSFHLVLEGLKAGGTDEAQIRDAIEGESNWVGLGGVVFHYSSTYHDGPTGGSIEWVVKNGQFTYESTLSK